MNKDLKKFGFELLTVLIMAAAPIISNFVNGKYDIKGKRWNKYRHVNRPSI